MTGFATAAVCLRLHDHVAINGVEISERASPGVKMTFVNGEILLEDGEQTGAFSGVCWDTERIFEFLT